MNVSGKRLFWGLCLSVFVVSCKNEITGSLLGEATPVQLGTVALQAVYPTNSNWMDYVKNDNGGTGVFDQPDVACDGTEVGSYQACIHGGEKRKIELGAYTSCQHITAVDSLNAFNWTCLVDGGQATVFLNGLQPGKGLRDLMNGSGWLVNSVHVYYKTTLIGQTTPSVWWSNPIVDAPDNSASAAIALDGVDDGGNDDVFSEGTIFRVTSTRLSSGYNLNLDKLGFVIFEGERLDYCESGTNSCDYATGELVLSERCMLSAGSQKFLWIEGIIDGKTAVPSDKVVQLVNSRFNRLNNVEIRNGSDTGLVLHDASSNAITGLKISTPGSQMSIYGDNADDNFLYNVVLANTTTKGAYFLNESDNNTLVKVKSYNHDREAFYFDNSDDNTLVDLISMNNGNAAIHVLNGSGRATISHFLSMNEDDESVYFNSGGNHTLNQFLAVNNGDGFGSLLISSTSNNIFSQIVVANSNDMGIEMSASSNNYFTNNILIGTTALAECQVSGGTNPGIDSSCVIGGLSDGSVRLGVDLASSIFAKVVSNDSANASDTDGQAGYSTLLDWFNFENWFRSWGRNGSSFPNNNNTVDCKSGTCRIWDSRILASDAQVLNRSGDGLNPNEAFVAGQACPSAVHGSVVLTDQNSTPRTFLVNAVEIIGDYIGNDNGLCESGESCIYSPNFGAYQGEGDYLSGGTCAFQDGTVSGVRMYAYPTNGA